MLVVSTRDFRANQSRYLSMANAGENIILKSRLGNYQITPIVENDNSRFKKELKNALLEVKDHLAGKRKLETLDDLINEL